MPLTLPYPLLANGNVVDPAQINTNNAAIAAKFNAGIIASDLSANAAILNSQLANKYEHMEARLRYGTGSAIPAAWPGGNGLTDYWTVIGTTGAAPWQVTDVYWMCSDTGDGLGSFNVVWGEWTAGGVWSTVTTLLAAPQVMSNAAALEDGNDGVCVLAASPTTLAVGAGPRHLALMSTNAGVGLLSAARDQIVVACRLRREISAL